MSSETKLAELIKLEAGSPERSFAFQNVGGLIEDIKPIDWLIRDYLERDTVSCVYGPPGCGKSLLAVDMAACVASGTHWHGRDIKSGAVFYIAGEGHQGLARRFRAWSELRGVSLTDCPLYVSNMSAELTDAPAARGVSDAVEKLRDATGVRPVLIVVDTLARNFGAADENSTADMNRFITHMDRYFKFPWNASVLIVHHSGKDNGKGARGSSSLKAAMDAEFEVTKSDDNLVRLRGHKMKDGPIPEPLAFQIEGIPLPFMDDDLNPIFGPVIKPTDYVEPPKQKRGKNQVIALESLRALYAKHQENLSAGGNDPAEARVLLEDWREDCELPRARFFEVKDSLSEIGDIQIQNGYAMLASEMRPK